MADRYAVIGNPVEHSLSPAIHAEFARATGQGIVYERILAPLEGFREAALRFRDEGGKGLNVTLPFKHEAWQLAATRSGFALAAGALNTLTFRGHDIIGDNTDGIGLVRDLLRNVKVALRGKQLLLMGAGGASYGVLEPLLREEPERVVVANRTVEKAVSLVEHFGKFRQYASQDITACSYEKLQGERFDIVINATSAGLADTMPPLPAGIFAPGALGYDMVYARRTPFMQFAAEQGARVSDGLGMLVEQAAESFFIWRGVYPETRAAMAMLRRQMPG